MPHKDPDHLCIVMKNNAIYNNVKAIVEYRGELFEEKRVGGKKRRLCALFFVFLKYLLLAGISRDTDRISYRCFLPDLTRFVTVCCAVSGK